MDATAKGGNDGCEQEEGRNVNVLELSKFFAMKFQLREKKRFMAGLVEYINLSKRYLGETDLVYKTLQNEFVKASGECGVLQMQLRGMEGDVKEALSTVNNHFEYAVLMLHYYEGLAWNEVAMILRMQEEDVRAAANRSIKKYRINSGIIVLPN